jgi:FkbM family methyltransferase
MNVIRRLESRHRAWRYRVRKDPDEIRWLRGVLSPGDVVVDAGAYKGGYTLWMRNAVGPAGEVYAFEPQPELADFLRKAVTAFGWENVHVREAGLSSEGGERVLHAPVGGPSQSASLVVEHEGARSYPVRLESLDSFFSRLEALAEGSAERGAGSRVSLIKCDVEGHELAVFQGAARLLEKHRPKLLFECEVRHVAPGRVHDVFRYLESFGYHGSFFHGGRLIDISHFDPSTHQVPGRLPYANNFVFESATSPSRAGHP